MKFLPLLILLLCGRAWSAHAQNVASRTVEAYGARGDCVTDDTAAFNAYAAALRTLTGYSGYRQFTLSSGKCYILHGSVNLTALPSTIFEGNGSTLVGSVSGYAILDAVQSTGIIIKDLYCISAGTPTSCIQIGRALAPGTVTGIADTNSSNNSIQNVFTNGTFTRGAVYTRASEVTSLINDTIENQYSGSYALIADGDAHFQITSLYGATYNPDNPGTVDNGYPYSALSFRDQVMIGGTLQSQGGPAVWMANVGHHQYIGTYVNAAASGPAAIIYFHTGDIVQAITWSVHSEPTTITSDFLISGTAASPLIIEGLRYEQHIDEATNSVFVRDSGVTSARINDLQLHIQGFLTNTATLFDTPSDWAVDGYVFTPAGSSAMNLTGSEFTGISDVGGLISNSVNFTYSTSAVLPQIQSTPASAGSGGLYLCQDASGNLYRKSSCP